MTLVFIKLSIKIMQLKTKQFKMENIVTARRYSINFFFSTQNIQFTAINI